MIRAFYMQFIIVVGTGSPGTKLVQSASHRAVVATMNNAVYDPDCAVYHKYYCTALSITNVIVNRVRMAVEVKLKFLSKEKVS